ncbi:MAG: tripartite tricarboxylate transporter TctB family protein [Hylemonella sp.]
MKINDALSGAILLALSLAILYLIRDYPIIPGQNIGPAAFPGLLAGLLAVCSLALIWRGLRKQQRGSWLELGAWIRSGYHLRNFLLTLVALLFYILVSDALGFILTALILLSLLFWALRVRPLLILPLALGVTLLIHLIFYKGLRVPLPWGILLPYQW